jgi:hypothetical protein
MNRRLAWTVLPVVNMGLVMLVLATPAAIAGSEGPGEYGSVAMAAAIMVLRSLTRPTTVAAGDNNTESARTL